MIQWGARSETAYPGRPRSTDRLRASGKATFVYWSAAREKSETTRYKEKGNGAYYEEKQFDSSGLRLVFATAYSKRNGKFQGREAMTRTDAAVVQHVVMTCFLFWVSSDEPREAKTRCAGKLNKEESENARVSSSFLPMRAEWKPLELSVWDALNWEFNFEAVDAVPPTLANVTTFANPTSKKPLRSRRCLIWLDIDSFLYFSSFRLLYVSFSQARLRLVLKNFLPILNER